MDNPEGAVNLAKTVAKQPGPPIDLNTMADMFLQRNMVREATAFLLEVLQDNDPQHDKLQTKVRVSGANVHLQAGALCLAERPVIADDVVSLKYFYPNLPSTADAGRVKRCTRVLPC